MRRSETGFWAHRSVNAEDPHLQYLRVDGLRPMEGNLDMDGYSIINADEGSFSGNVDALSFNSINLTESGIGNKFLSDDGSYKAVSSSGVLSLQAAYEGGNTITTDDGYSDLVVYLTEASEYLVNLVGTGNFNVTGVGTSTGSVSIIPNGSLTLNTNNIAAGSSNIQVQTGAASGGVSGSINIGTGTSADAAQSGSISITSGGNSVGDAGDILLTAGLGVGTDGAVVINAGGNDLLRFNGVSAIPSAGQVLGWDGTQNVYVDQSTGGSLDGYVYEDRQIIAGNGLTGGGDLSADRTLDVVANADGSIVVNANDIQVGVLASDAQHGNLGGGSLHDLATDSVAGFFSADGYVKLEGIEAGAQVNTVDSVFGRTGDVIAVTGDYDSDQVTNASAISGSTVSDALETLNSLIVGGGSGTVSGPDTTTDNAIARWSGTDGYTIQNSGIVIDDSDNITGVNDLSVGGNITVTGTVDGRDVSVDGATLDSHVADTTIHFTAESLGLDGYTLEIDFQSHITDTSIHFTAESLNLDGYVLGPVSSTDNAVARYDGTTGKLIQNSVVTLDDTGNYDGVVSTNYTPLVSASWPTWAEGTIFYDGDNNCLAYYDDYADVTVQVGQENHIRCVNTTGATITNGQVVYFNGTQGNRPTIGLALSSDEARAHAIGVATTDIPNNAEGPVTVFGSVRGLNTLAWSAGDILYVSDTTPGLLTNVKPSGNDYVWVVGVVLNSTVTGSIFVGTQGPEKLTDLHDVNGLTSAVDGYYLRGNGTLWEGRDFDADVLALADVLGPDTSIDNAIARYDGTTGKLIQNSAVTVDDSGNLAGIGNITLTGTVDGRDVSVDGATLDAHVADGSIHFTAESLELDGYALTTDIMTPPSNPDEDGYIPIAQGGDLTYLRGSADGYVLTWNEGGETWEDAAPKKSVTIEFALTEEVNNTTAYFFTGAGHSTGGLRSSANTGLQNANNCSPYMVPFNATIKKAILRVYGVGVQNGSVTYPVSYETNLLRVNASSETKLSDVDFSISNSFTVGTFSVGATDFTGSTTLSVDVDEGQMLGMQFENGSSASVAGQTRMAFITLVLEER